MCVLDFPSTLASRLENEDKYLIHAFTLAIITVYQQHQENTTEIQQLKLTAIIGEMNLLTLKLQCALFEDCPNN